MHPEFSSPWKYFWNNKKNLWPACDESGKAFGVKRETSPLQSEKERTNPLFFSEHAQLHYVHNCLHTGHGYGWFRRIAMTPYSDFVYCLQHHCRRYRVFVLSIASIGKKLLLCLFCHRILGHCILLLKFQKNHAYFEFTLSEVVTIFIANVVEY